jgi:HD-GYP domain-containing protein (c-di-GMP phosphodiesterase class II)
MYIHELCGSWLEHPFWRESFRLARQGDLNRIVESNITEVWIDTDRGLDVEQEQSAEVSEQQVESFIARMVDQHLETAPATQRVSMKEELEHAAKICATSRLAVTDMFQQARMGRAIDSEKAVTLVSEISASVLRNPGALISVARLKTVDDYTYMHSVAVCALMIALGRKLGLPEAEIREAGLAGLLHDVGKMAIPLTILNKPGRLTNEEFARVQDHPAEGHRMLRKGGGVSDLALDVCLHHHEKIDGSGYPDRLSGERISLYAKMGAVCDVYDAITSDRPYKKGWDPSEALHKMTEWKNGHFDEAVFSAFVKSLGIYPVGSLVRMQSGRLGVVVEQAEASLIAPKVKVFFSTRAQTRIVPEVIDLSKPWTIDKIASREDPEKWGFRDLAALWQHASAATTAS